MRRIGRRAPEAASIDRLASRVHPIEAPRSEQSAIARAAFRLDWSPPRTEKVLSIARTLIITIVPALLALAAPATALAAPKDLSPEFRIPPGGVLRESVDFWLQVYGKLTSREGMIHDSKYPLVIYRTYDFSKGQEPRSVVVKREKARFRDILLRLHEKGVGGDFSKITTLTDPEEKRVAELFRGIDDPNRFLNAAHFKRLRFQLGQKDRFLEGVLASGEYLPFMEKVFIDRGMPWELTRLPFVESSFNTKARSKVGASGIWQFMRTTGRDFLEIDDAVDERNDPIRATEAAAELLRINHETLDNWPLAVTAYNHGRSSLLRASNRLGTRDLETILLTNRARGFGFASANFFACLVAAIEVERNSEKYFGEIDRRRAHRYYEVRLPAAIRLRDLVSFMKLSRKAILELNPGFTPAAIASELSISKGYRLRLPNDGSGTDSEDEARRRIFLAGFAKIPKLYKRL
jgi:membrane-bound lytic murein transglycosylase D